MKNAIVKILSSAFLLSSLAACSSVSTSVATASSTASAAATTSATATTTSTTTTTTSHAGPGTTSGGGNPGGGSSSGSGTYASDHEYSSGTSTVDSPSWSSTSADNDVVLVDGGKVMLNNGTFTKSGDTSSADNSSFYGQNASLLAKSGTLYVNGGSISSTGEGGAGIASYSSGISYSKGVSINTTANAAGGLHACGGGTLYAWNDTATTSGEHSAAIRSDRGGGTMRIFNGTYSSSGSGSPAIYCTADIQASEATLTATGSEAFSMEGKNSTSLFDCALTGNMPSSSNNYGLQWNVIVYQSQSGDSATGTGNFSMVGGTLKANAGGMFFTTNTSSEFYLKNVTLDYSAADPFLFRATGFTRWGSNGSNGATSNFTAEDQTLAGKVIYDGCSTIDMYLRGTSAWTGAFEEDSTYANSISTGTHSLSIASGATWNVASSCSVTNLYNAGTISGAKIVSASGTTLGGDTSSSVIVTVSGTYSTNENTGYLSAPTQDTSETFPTSI